MRLAAGALDAALSQGALVIAWDGEGLLQSATTLFGPYLDLPTATSPIIIDPANPKEFYRLKQ